MKKKIDFSKQGGFPFTQATLDFMQESYKSILQTLISYLGVPATGHYIISGVETSGTYLTSGWVVVDGEVLPFKQSTKGASPKVVVQESKRSVAFKNATSQDVYIDRWAEASQTQGTALASFTRVKQPGGLIEKTEAINTFLGKTAKAADSDKLDGKDAAAFQPKGNYLTAHQSLANYHTKTEAINTFLGKTAKAADSDKLDGKDAADFLLASSKSDATSLNDSNKIATSKAVKTVNDKIPNWASDGEDFLHVICAGRVTKSGSRGDYWGKNRVGTGAVRGTSWPFYVEKLSATGQYKITHFFGSKYYGLVGNGNIGSDIYGYNMFVSIKERYSNYCIVEVGNDSAPDDAAFSFILFDLN